MVIEIPLRQMADQNDRMGRNGRGGVEELCEKQSASTPPSKENKLTVISNEVKRNEKSHFRTTK